VLQQLDGLSREAMIDAYTRAVAVIDLWMPVRARSALSLALSFRSALSLRARNCTPRAPRGSGLRAARGAPHAHGAGQGAETVTAEGAMFDCCVLVPREVSCLPGPSLL
jgi:hypothetical protein